MNSTVISVILSVLSLSSITLGVALYSRVKELSARFFALLALFAGLWIAVEIARFYQYSYYGGPVYPFILTKIAYALFLTTFYFRLLFAWSFPQNKLLFGKPILILITCVYLIAVILVFIPGAVLSEDKFIPGTNYASINMRGLFYRFYYVPILLIYYFLSAGRMVYLFFKVKERLLARQLRYILVGCPISGIAGIGFNIAAPFMPNPWNSLPIGEMAIFLFVVLSSYAIFKHHLFNLKIITTEIFGSLVMLILLVNTILSESLDKFIFNLVMFFVVSLFNVLLIKSVFKEVKQKEELQVLSGELRNLNDHLEQKVAAQTVEIRKAYEVEKKARIELEELDKAKDRFILTTQHNLRTPLTIVKGYIESLLKKPPKSTLGENEEVLTKTSVAVDRLSGLTNELLKATEVQINKESAHEPNKF